MANLNVNARFSAPENIDIELVRADLLGTSSNYRTFFEIFLSLSSALVGVVFSSQNITSLHWLFLGVVSISSIVFLIMSIMVMKKAKEKQLTT